MASRVGVLTMFIYGLRVVLWSLPLMLPVALLNGMAFGYFDHQLNGWIEAILTSKELGQSISQAFAVAAIVLGLYFVLQLTKRKTASWLSWIPTLFLPSCVIISALVATQNELTVSLSLRISLELTWMCTVGGMIYGLWVCLSYAYGKGSIGGAVSRLKRAGLGFLAPHGGSTLLIYLGMQVLIPGLIYAVIYSFVDHAAILKPEDSPFKTSTNASKGMRRPIVLLFVITLLPAIIGRMVLTVWSEQMFYQLGWSDAFVKDGVFDASSAWDNVIAMFFGAPWGGAFYSEGLALAAVTLITGIAASGLTLAFLSRVDVAPSGPVEETA